MKTGKKPPIDFFFLFSLVYTEVSDPFLFFAIEL